MKKKKIKVWGINSEGKEIKEHDKLLCGSGLDKWHTHVMFNHEDNTWHRESDYMNGKLIGSYLNS